MNGGTTNTLNLDLAYATAISSGTGCAFPAASQRKLQSEPRLDKGTLQ